MSLNELRQMLEQYYPRLFIAESVNGKSDETRLRRRGGPDFADEDVVGFYNLEDASLDWDMIAEDIDFFLSQDIR
jgi:hypothetical protein